MAFPNSNYTDIIATTIEARSGEAADNVTKNNALLAMLKKKGKVKPLSGGRTIVEEIIFAENGNGGSYDGYDILPVSAQDVISAAEFNWKQYAVPVVISGRELLQNSGKEAVIDMMEARVEAAEATMANLICQGLYGDGTGNGSKVITGLDAAVPQDPTTGTYGGINRATASNAFWRSQIQDPAATPDSTTIRPQMNLLWAKTQRGPDRPDLIIAGGTIWATYMESLQSLQRFTDKDSAGLGFPSVDYMGSPVVLDGGIGGFATATDMYFLNTKYLKFRPHRERNMVPLSPGKRHAVNQDAEVVIIGWMGNLTCSGAQFQGRGKFD